MILKTVKRLAWCVGLTLGAVGSQRSANGDVVFLKDGQRVEGNVTYESSERLHVDTTAGLVIVRVADIQRRIVTAPPANPVDPKERERIRRQVNKLTMQIRAIRDGYLGAGTSSRAERLRAEGEKKILEIRDPLAIGPLTRVLSVGDALTREILVDALSRFDDDEALMNLVVVAVLDPDAIVRRKAVEVLLNRPDPRVVEDLRVALQSNEDEVVRNAAEALGILRAREAAHDLVDLLSFSRRMNIEIPRAELLATIEGSYIAGIRYRVAPGVAQAEPIIGTVSTGSAIGNEPIVVRRTVTVFRTEVQEALIAITGENFGFDEDAWRLWLAQHMPARTAPFAPGTTVAPPSNTLP